MPPRRGQRQRREQDPLASVQGHVAYTFRPQLWLALDATFYDGGATMLDGVTKDDRQSNSLYGLTLILIKCRLTATKATTMTSPGRTQ